MNSEIVGVGIYLPKNKLTNNQIQDENPDWPMEKIYSKSGIKERRISDDNAFSFELAIKAVENLFFQNIFSPADIDFVIVCTLTQKSLITVTSCMIQSHFNLKNNCGTLDLNLGCSGYTHSLIIADSLISKNLAKNVLLVTSDTISKLIASDNRQSRPLFGDAATATLIRKTTRISGIICSDWGSDGKGACHIGAATAGIEGLTKRENKYNPDFYMDGSEVLNFMLDKIPNFFRKLITNSRLNIENIQHIIFHQANKYILKILGDKLMLPEEKFHINMEYVGNTSSSSIPIVLHNLINTNKISRGEKIALVGFGTGLSWSGLIFQW